MDVAGLADLPIEQSKATPEGAFYYTYATNLLDQVLADLEEQYCGTGRAAHWEVFKANFLGPFLKGTKSPALSELCEKHGIEKEKKASNMVQTVKRRFASVLRQHIRLTVQSDEEAEEELREIIKILSEWHTA